MSGMRLRFLFVACISISSLVRAEDKDTARCLGGACRTTLPSSSGCGKSAMTQFSPPVDGIRLHPIRRLSLTSSGKSTLECAEACVSRGEVSIPGLSLKRSCWLAYFLTHPFRLWFLVQTGLQIVSDPISRTVVRTDVSFSLVRFNDK